MSSQADYANLFSCEGKVALVIGAGGLLGREVVAGLAAAGAEVWEADVSATDAPRSLALDVADEASVTAALDAVLASSGRLDVLVNCAYPRTSDWGTPIERESSASWMENLEAHLGGAFVASRAAAERMKAGGGGSIVNFGSIYGMVGPSWEVYAGTEMTMPSAYAAIKGGIIAMDRFLATRYGEFGVRVNTVSPGGVFDEQAGEFVQRYEALTPLRRMARPADSVGAVVFLASDAAAYVTGQNLAVDGGWTAR